MLSPAQRLLQSLAKRTSRPEIERTRPDLLPLMVGTGRAWEEVFAEVGFGCPAALTELGEAVEQHFVHVDDDHGWDLLSPEGAREERGFLVRLATQFPELVVRSRMVPVFGKDGDLLLLASDGRVWVFTHDDWERDGVVAESFDELLVALANRERLRERFSPRGVDE